MMKKSRIQNIALIATVVCLLSTESCSDDFFEVPPTGFVSENDLTNQSGVEDALIGAYGQLLGRRWLYSDAGNWFWGSVLGGDANKGAVISHEPQINEIQAYAVQTNNLSVAQKYDATYEGVARTNIVLKLLASASDVADDDRIRITAEARFLRGHYYFDLKKNFDKVPYVDETWDERTPVPNDQDLWPFIENDFRFAMDNLDDVTPNIGRANKWAAAAYLAKTYLYQGKWAQAKELFDQITTNGATSSGELYGLMAHYAQNFRSIYDNGKESVFAIQAAVGTGSLNNANPALVFNFPHGFIGPPRPGGCCGFNQPSFELVNSFRTDPNTGLPLTDGAWNSAGEEIISDMGLLSGDPFTVDPKPIDPRVDHSTGRRDIPYLDWGPHPGFDWIRLQSNGGPFSPKKFVYYAEGIGVENDLSGVLPGFTAVNQNIIRYADVLLMAAEAEIELGNVHGGIALINQVRTRAANSLIPNSPANYHCAVYPSGLSQEEAREAVRIERKIELSGEGHRLYDLVRWGIAADELNEYLAYESQFIPGLAGAVFTANKNEYLPIPQDEIDLKGEDVLVQNPGY